MADDAVRMIKERLDIVEVVGDYVRLRRVGQNFSGLCPFHEEKTPSFSVSPSRQTYHCFGCGQGGDIFSFIMAIEGLSFPEALEMLAKRAGVQLDRERKSRTPSNLYEIMEYACKIYRENLKAAKGSVGQAYLRHRRISSEFQERFELGWAPSSWDYLMKKLSEAGIPSREAEACGLIIQGQRGYYDRFRSRVIFPIRDISGRLIAFGGRIVGGDGAKYLNSPESDLYSKRRCLYLLNAAKGNIRERKRAILVEGYMDALRLHISGFSEGVASLGTALTERQAALLKRLTDKCYICYDSDSAGQEATLRGMYVLQRAGLNVFVMDIPRGKDPDELLSSEGGTELFEQALSEASPLVRYHICTRKRELESPETRKSAADDLLRGFSQLQPVEVTPFLPELRSALGVTFSELEWMLEASRTEARGRKDLSLRDKGDKPIKNTIVDIDPLEAALCYLLWTDRKRRRISAPGATMSLVESESAKSLIMALLSGESPAQLENRWLSTGETLPMSIISTGGSFCEEVDGGECDRWETVTACLKKRQMTLRYNRLRARLLDGSADKGEIKEFQELASLLKGGTRP